MTIEERLVMLERNVRKDRVKLRAGLFGATLLYVATFLAALISYPLAAAGAACCLVLVVPALIRRHDREVEFRVLKTLAPNATGTTNSTRS